VRPVSVPHTTNNLPILAGTSKLALMTEEYGCLKHIPNATDDVQIAVGHEASEGQKEPDARLNVERSTQ